MKHNFPAEYPTLAHKYYNMQIFTRQLNLSLFWTGNTQMLHQSALLGCVYAIQLFAYQLFVLVLPEGYSMWKDHLALNLHTGMLLGSIFWAWLLLKKHDLNQVLKWSLMVSAAALLWQSIIFYENIAPLVLSLSRFMFGFGFAAVLAISLNFVDQMPSYTRTRAGALVMSIGMIGPLFAVLLPIKNELRSAYLCVAGILILSPLLFPLPKDDKKFGTWTEENNYSLSQFAFTFPTGRIFWSCVAVGWCVSIFSDLLNILPNLYTVLKDKLNIVYGCRYPGMALGSLLAAWLSIQKQNRKQVISVILGGQAITLLLLLFPKIFWEEATVSVFLLGTFIFVSGLGNGFWLILLLHASEQFTFRHRRIANVLVLAGSRSGAIFLLILNVCYNKNTDTGFIFWYNDFPGFLLFYGLMFILIGLVAAPFLAERFEGEAVEADYNAEWDTKTKQYYSMHPFEGETDRNKFLDTVKKWKTTNSNDFLEETKGVFRSLFYTHFRNTVYFSGLFWSDPNNKQLFRAGFDSTAKEKEGEAIQETFDFYNKGLDGGKTHEFHRTIQSIILSESKNARAQAITNWMMYHEDQEIAGALFWFGGTEQSLNNKYIKEKNLRTFNLSQIRFKPEFSNYSFTIARAKMPTNDQGEIKLPDAIDWLNDLYDKVEFDLVQWERFIASDHRPEWDLGIQLNALLHRLDCEVYAPGTYYAYYIKSFNTQNKLIGTLSIKSAVAIGLEHLRGIRNLLTFVVLQRGAALLEWTNANMILELQHNNKTFLESIRMGLSDLGTWFKHLNKVSRFQADESDDFIKQYVNTFRLVRTIETISYYNDYLAERSKFSDGEEKVIEDKYKSVIKKEDFKLSSVLLPLLEDLAKLDDLIELISNTSKEMFFKQIKEKVAHNFSVNDPKLYANKAVFEVICWQLLLNAIKNNDNHNPMVEILTKQHERGTELIFKNRWSQTFQADHRKQERFKQSINNKNFTWAGFGLATVLRYLESFNPNWEMNCEYEQQNTLIILHIPEQYLSLN